MKRSQKDFRKYVSDIRRMVPTYSNGRKVVVVAEDTKKGEALIALAGQWEGNDLRQIYDRPSDAKKAAFDEAWNMYTQSRHGTAFGICSHNTFGFTVSWVHDDGITVLTKDTEYLVICNE